MKKPRQKFYYRGQVERVRRAGRYAWCDGYSANTAEGLTLFPWMTKTECRTAAREQGSVAVFVDVAALR